MIARPITLAEKEALTQQALEARIGKKVYLFKEPIAKRSDDAYDTLWHYFNTLQEYTIRGGLRYYDSEADEWKRTRKISAVDRTIKINKALWNSATELLAV